ncbi:Protein M05D6.6 [Aphelenchoides avenae]|nr:Protein M05D6.6 [Aphelenchus avenae]
MEKLLVRAALSGRIRPSRIVNVAHIQRRPYAVQKGIDPEENKSQAQAPKGHIAYETKSKWKENEQEQRKRRAESVGPGQEWMSPTANQRWMLVISGLFKSRKEIPDKVPRDTMAKMYRRMYGIAIATGIMFYFVLKFAGEDYVHKRIREEAAAGRQVGPKSIAQG